MAGLLCILTASAKMPINKEKVRAREISEIA